MSVKQEGTKVSLFLCLFYIRGLNLDFPLRWMPSVLLVVSVSLTKCAAIILNVQVTIWKVEPRTCSSIATGEFKGKKLCSCSQKTFAYFQNQSSDKFENNKDLKVKKKKKNWKIFMHSWNSSISIGKHSNGKQPHYLP